jgi:hypothetical protein
VRQQLKAAAICGRSLPTRSLKLGDDTPRARDMAKPPALRFQASPLAPAKVETGSRKKSAAGPAPRSRGAARRAF